MTKDHPTRQAQVKAPLNRLQLQHDGPNILQRAIPRPVLTPLDRMGHKAQPDAAKIDRPGLHFVYRPNESTT